MSSYHSTVPNAKNEKLEYTFSSNIPSNTWTATIRRTRSRTDVPLSEAVSQASCSGAFPNSSGTAANTLIDFAPGDPIQFETPGSAYRIGNINSAETVYAEEILNFQEIRFGMPCFGGGNLA
jgi:hypothetical protein